MADVFISYATEDRPQAERLARALEGEGFGVWWDVESLRSGQSFNQAIQQALPRAKCVVVLWSGASVKSKWVEAEAYWAWDHNKLYSIRLDDAVAPPVPFNTIHARNLASWDESTDFPEFLRLTADIAAMVGRPKPDLSPSPQPGTAEQPAEPEPTLVTHNLGMVDRIIRIVVGLILVGNVYVGLQTPIGWLGLILILTGAFGICPLYALLGINTKSVGEKLGLK